MSGANLTPWRDQACALDISLGHASFATLDPHRASAASGSQTWTSSRSPSAACRFALNVFTITQQDEENRRDRATELFPPLPQGGHDFQLLSQLHCDD